MATLIYDSFIDDVTRNAVDVDGDTFYMLLVTASYTADKGAHTKRSDITNEITGTNYTAGGQSVALTVSKDTVNHKVTIQPAVTTWASASFTARAAVIYKHRGGAAGSDELVCYLDFGADKTASGGSFVVTTSTPISLQN